MRTEVCCSRAQHVKGGVLCVWQRSSMRRRDLIQDHLWPPFLFTALMHGLTYEVPWNDIFEDDIVICNEGREQVEDNPEMWKCALRGGDLMLPRQQHIRMCLMRGTQVQRWVYSEQRERRRMVSNPELCNMWERETCPCRFKQVERGDRCDVWWRNITKNQSGSDSHSFEMVSVQK